MTVSEAMKVTYKLCTRSIRTKVDYSDELQVTWLYIRMHFARIYGPAYLRNRRVPQRVVREKVKGRLTEKRSWGSN